MQNSRVLSRAAKSYLVKDLAVPLPSLSLWRDVPTLSRYAGHIILGLLFVALVYSAVPLDIKVPSLDSLTDRRSGLSGEYAIPVQPDVAPSARYLEPGTIPFTIRAWGNTLPSITEPQRAVRSTVMVYSVQPGDTVLGIAEKFGLKGTSLLYANASLAANPDFLQIGQELNILPLDGAYHTVASGETVESIAKTYKVTAEAVISYVGNALSEPYTLTAGQQLIIPGGVIPYVPSKVVTYQGPAPKGSQSGTGQFSWPMSGQISQRYWEGHRAIDIHAKRGTSISAADGGYVVQTQYSDYGYGRMIVIDHGNGYQTLYAHMDAFYVEKGQSVAKGEVIGKCGSTGNSTGPHLHFEVRKGGGRYNPINFLP